MNLNTFLATKPFELTPFEPARFVKAYEQFCRHFADNTPKIQIIGTNGKGSTGRFLAQSLEASGFKVLHFSSPHLLDFAERFYSSGQNIAQERLEQAHQYLQSLPLDPHLSYFEYATLLAVVLAKDCDYMVVEAGLGGEFDSTTSLNKRIALVFTPISLDHTDRLGSNLLEIAATKLKAGLSLEPHAPIIFAKQEPEVQDLAKELLASKNLTFIEGLGQEAQREGQKWGYAPFLVQNLQSALSTLHALNLSPKAPQRLNLRGRFEALKPNVLLDVAHNVGGARALARALKGQQVDLIYNSYTRKDALGVLESLKPCLRHVWVLPVPDPQIMPQEKLQGILKQLHLPFSPFQGNLEPSKSYLVAGSFSVVRTFLQGVGFGG
ncbi:Mur ligase family protein [Helicobacter heilmannii]|uniref:Dihydrofolate synthase / Folylpolyglutamate synthase n=1 Tax=Helicobacter heilmannii TaxID=35817 RepID=A0A0K2YAN5_HELHE|nr:Mur ligase family protein [Helicobacter heilmannii]BDQ26354.1 bifunctional folylpolyglutamate synthase/dihydrofolate synthase [Helicobacter heilmannii]CCM11344.1 Dihydrofolate synthase [Helicobacter heilmannii ASB1.4]CRI34764.1 Dihydrofolate synthase / Folylpolyglutamate synthase [Helicobacter heilmannii]